MKRRENGTGSKGWVTRRGKRYYRIRLSNGKEFMATSKAEAEARAKKWTESQLYVLDSEGMDRQLYPALLSWLEDMKKPAFRAGTYETTLHLLNGTLRDHALAHIRLKNLTARHFTNYYMTLSEKYSYSTIHSNWVMIRQFLIYSNKKHWCNVDLDEIIIPNESRTKPKREIHPLSQNDMGYFKEECLRKYQSGAYVHSSGPLFLFLLSSGLRVEEALALTWGDVIRLETESRSFLQVNKTVKILHGQPHIQYLTKTASGMRRVPLSATLLRLLDIIGDMSTDTTRDALLFPSSTGAYRDYHNLYRTLDAICRNIRRKHPDFSYDHITLHDLRHSFASALIRNGVNAKEVQVLLGHANIQITLNTYVHVFEEQARSGINSFCLFSDESLE